jgi:hypothetical protein
MDITPDESLAPVSFSSPEGPAQVLSYDEDVPYESQIQPEGLGGSSLAGRIGKGKVYFLADAERMGKVSPSLPFPSLYFVTKLQTQNSIRFTTLRIPT